ncbi:MAG: cytochrome c maturation protein CcmE, partial [Pseudomonadota bacterium]
VSLHAEKSKKFDLPDLFREGSGVVATGSFDSAGAFKATELLAKHDENYVPRELQHIEAPET